MPTRGRPSELNDVISYHRNNGTSWYTWEKYDENGNKMLTDAQAKWDAENGA